MIASVHHKITGNEERITNQTKLRFYPASGYKIIDVIINGTSRDFNTLNIDEEKGEVITGELLTRGDDVVCVYKTIPRFVFEQREFDPENFAFGEFA